MFSVDDDDQDFLSPSGGSRLASLFGGVAGDVVGESESLKYTAPKQPRKSFTTPMPGSDRPSDGASSSGGLMAACAVHAYKYQDAKYTSQGKVGCALIGNWSQKEYKLLLYYSKQHPLMQTTIRANFTFTVQKNRYATIYDEESKGWSLMFEKDEDVVKFAQQMTVARFSQSEGATSVAQDVLIGDGAGARLEDGVEIMYQVYTLHGHQTNLLSEGGPDKFQRFKLGRGKFNQALEDSLVGLARAGRRFVLLHPSHVTAGQKQQSTTQGPITALLYDVTLVRVKFKEPALPEPLADAPAPTATPSVSNSESTSRKSSTADEETVKERSRSISEQLAHSPERSGKAKLLSRMAKMGQAVIPHLAPQSPDVMDDVAPGNSNRCTEDEPDSATPVSLESEPTDVTPSQTRVKPGIPHKPQVQHPPIHQYQHYAMPQAPMHPMMTTQPMMGPGQPVMMPGQPYSEGAGMMGQNMAGGQQLAVYQSPQPLYQPPAYHTAVPTVYPTQTQPASSASSGSDNSLNVYMSESRQQSTEVRLTLSKVCEQIDRLHEKVERALPSQSNAPVPSMESSMLLHNLQRIIEENQTLKRTLMERGQKIHEQNEKIQQLLNKTHSVLEESNTMVEERSLSYKQTAQQSQARQLQLEQEKVALAQQVSVAMSQLSDVTMELNEAKRQNIALNQQVSDQAMTKRDSSSELIRVKTSLSESELALQAAQTSLNQERMRRKDVETQLRSVQAEAEESQERKQNLEKLLSERKKKQEDERRQSDTEIEELKRQHDIEVKRLQDKLRQHISSTHSNTDDKVSKLEEELNADWQRKYDRMTTALNEKHERASRELRDELDASKDLTRQATEKYQKLLSQSNSMKSEHDNQMSVLEGRLDDNLNKAREMKGRFETRIAELLEEQSDARRALEEQERRDGTTGGESADVANEIKSIMSKVYHELRGKLLANEKYSGVVVQQLILNTIKETTLRLVSVHSQPEHNKGSGSDDDEDEEGGDEEEEEEEDEEDEEEEEEEESDDSVVEDDQSATVNTGKLSASQTSQNNADSQSAPDVEPCTLSPSFTGPVNDQAGLEAVAESTEVGDESQSSAAVARSPPSSNGDFEFVDKNRSSSDNFEFLDQAGSGDEASGQKNEAIGTLVAENMETIQAFDEEELKKKEDDNQTHQQPETGDQNVTTSSQSADGGQTGSDNSIASIDEQEAMGDANVVMESSSQPTNGTNDDEKHMDKSDGSNDDQSQLRLDKSGSNSIESGGEAVPDSAEFERTDGNTATMQSAGETEAPSQEGEGSSLAPSSDEPLNESTDLSSPAGGSMSVTEGVAQDRTETDSRSEELNTVERAPLVQDVTSSIPVREAKPPSSTSLRVPPVDDFSDFFADDAESDPFGITHGGDFTSEVKPTSRHTPSKRNQFKTTIVSKKQTQDGRPQPPPPLPLFPDEDDEDDFDWLNK